MKYIYGPVNSRRIGFSLGLSLTPYKICSFDCVYCQLGRTTQLTIQRQEYLKIGEVIEVLRSWLKNNPQEAGRLNYITLSGSGEPTLNTKIADAIAQIKALVKIPVALITNSSLLADAAVRHSILSADLIVPSLDAAAQEVMKKIDGPADNIEVSDIIEGLVNLRKEYRGKIWLEVMLVKGINDNLPHIRKLKEAIDRINPDKIQLNSPVRAASDAGISVVGRNKLEKIKEILGDKAEII